jgi:hypothetical protein
MYLTSQYLSFIKQKSFTKRGTTDEATEKGKNQPFSMP